MKNVLVIHYSQSGQLSEIATNIAKPLLENPDIDVSFHTIEPVKPFPFPWNKDTFFDAFPESFLQIPTVLKPVSEEVLNKKPQFLILEEATVVMDRKIGILCNKT